jgi:crotonobetainyl-CoA:carnitine CoA-transferase CaiB-like acyl-CoA transferase
VATADGWISFTVNTDEQVRTFLRTTERQHLIDDPRFASVAARSVNVTEWFEIRGAPLTSKTTAEWLAVLRAADIAAQPCHSLESLQHDPHLRAVGLLRRQRHPTEGDVVAIRHTIKIDDAYAPLREPAHSRGFATRKILREVGYADHEIEAMVSSGAVIDCRKSAPHAETSWPAS